MSRTPTVLVAMLMVTAAGSVARADDGVQDAYVKVGMTLTSLSDQGTFLGNGVGIPGADYVTNRPAHVTLTGGYFFSDHWAGELSVNSPATTHSLPTGTLAGLPNFGNDTFVSADAMLTYHPERGQELSPYFGVGVRELITTKGVDGPAITNFHVGSSTGLVLQAGADYQIGDGFGIFVDAKKAFYNTLASGNLGPEAIIAHTKVDPVSVTFGISYGFGGSDYVATPDEAPSGDWFIKAGASMLSLQDNLNLSVGGTPTPGAKLASDNHFTPSVAIGWNFYDHFAAVLAVGLPPTIDIGGAGSIAALGKLSQVNYGAAALTIEYHPIETGWFRPYVGVGGSYLTVFNSTDAGLLLNTNMGDDLAPVVNAGVDFMLTDRYGFYIDVKKSWLQTHITGNLSGAPVSADAAIHPLVVSAGAIFNL